MKFTYDPDADAAYLYLADEIGFGQVKRSRLVPLRMKGASVIVSLGENGHALGVEFLGASKQLDALLLDAIVEASDQSSAKGAAPKGDESDG